MRVEFSAPAWNELLEAVAYYDGQRLGLGREFEEAVEQGKQQIETHPHAWQRLSRRARRYRLKKFPYGLVYRLEGDRAVVMAVMHLKRRPGYWKGRE